MSRTKLILLYIGVILFTTTLFLYLRFPTELVKDFIGAQVSKSAPGVDLDIETLTPNFPAGVTLKTVDISFENQPVFDAEEAIISGRPLSLLSDQKSIYYTLITSGGEIKGRAVFRNDVGGPEADVKAKFKSIQLKEIPAIKTFSGYNVAGLLDGTININGSNRNGAAQTAFTITQCTIELLQPFFGVEKLNFQLIETELAMNGQRVIVKKCDLNGDEVDGRITGSMTVRQPYGQTRLNLSGVLKPQPAFSDKLSKMVPMALLSGTNIQRKGIPFKINGTIDKPGFSLR